MFCWTENDLNEEQSNAIQEEENVFLIACPGSGKTRTLTYKIAYELSKLKSKKKYVVALTYTNRAADEIKERIEVLGVSTRQLWIGTIHSFCLDWILKPYSIYHHRLKDGFKLLNSHDTEVLITDLCSKLNSRPRITNWDCGYYISTSGFNYSCSDSSKIPLVRDVLNQYFEILSENNQIDFELILKFSYEILKENSIVPQILSNMFSMILIDEYQDTKEIQYHIVSSILKASNRSTKSFIVGDPNQAIYQSLGGYAIDPKMFAELSNITQKELSLSRNYRSSKTIVEYFKHFNVHGTEILTYSKDKNFPSIISYQRNISKDNIIDEIEYFIKKNIEELGTEQSEICIIAPWWVHLSSITRGLVSRMPQYSFNGPGLVPFARDLDNFWYKLSKIVLTEPSPKMYLRRLRWAKEVIDHLERVGINLNNITSKAFLRQCNHISIEEEEGLVYLEKFFEQLFEVFKISYLEYEELKEHYSSFFESSKARIDRLDREGTPSIGDIKSFRKVFKPKEGITVSTIHGVKGGEFDTVVAFGLLEGMVPHFSDLNGQENSKKLLYVLSSRAKKYLHLISEYDRPRGRDNVYPPTVQLLNYKYSYKLHK